MEREHQAMLALVPLAEVTNTAQANGLWSSATTWAGGRVPGSRAKVLIPEEITVTYDLNATDAIQWLRVEGTLRFALNRDTQLLVDTVVINVRGTWDHGTVENPITARSSVVFIGAGSVEDELKLGRGILSHGTVNIAGVEKTPFVQLAMGVEGGAQLLQLATLPSGWSVGDRIVITGMNLTLDARSEAMPTDEVRTISAIVGNSVTVDEPIRYRRAVVYPEHGLYPFVANLTRNVVYRSAPGVPVEERGHFMFMHKAGNISYAAFIKMGRTRKDIDVTDVFGDPGPVGANPRGRYAVHFHRTGKDHSEDEPAVVRGSVVDTPTGWGFVNHDSYVDFEDNVAYAAFGAAYVTEMGGELGTFRHNLASDVRGRGFIKDGVENHDLGRGGIGYWFQGGNITVETNIVSGAVTGYSYFERTGVDTGDESMIFTRNLISPDAAGGRDFIYNQDTPIQRFYGNTSMGCFGGMYNVDVESNGQYPTESLIENYTDLNSWGSALHHEYYRTLTLRNVKLLRDSPADPRWEEYAIVADVLEDHLFDWPLRSAARVDGLVIRGYHSGIENHSEDTDDERGQPTRATQFEILSNSFDFVGPGRAVHDYGSVRDYPLVRSYEREGIVEMPRFVPAAGSYEPTIPDVYIETAPGTRTYYVAGSQSWPGPDFREETWIEYTGGPIRLTGDQQRVIAISYRGNLKSRIRVGDYFIRRSRPGD